MKYPVRFCLRDFIVVKGYEKISLHFRYYVIKIRNEMSGGYGVSFLKRLIATNKFSNENQTGFVSKDDVVYKLPLPIKSNRARFANMTLFLVDFSEFSFTISEFHYKFTLVYYKLIPPLF